MILFVERCGGIKQFCHQSVEIVSGCICFLSVYRSQNIHLTVHVSQGQVRAVIDFRAVLLCEFPATNAIIWLSVREMCRAFKFRFAALESNSVFSHLPCSRVKTVLWSQIVLCRFLG
ncbi:hypothetical protein Ancab_031772 [Ancistrocladus abbreviatus]